MKMLAKKIVKDADGQVLVLFALFLVVLIGFTALVVDVGAAYSQRTNLQKAADAAALAGAQDLTNVGDAVKTAVEYTGKNGLNVLTENIVTLPENKFKASGDTGTDLVTVTTPYVDPKTNIADPSKIEVVCKKTVKYSFARVLGFKETDVSARAVAKKGGWTGDALPFINLDGDGEDSTKGQPLSAWDKVDPGAKERIHNDDLVINTNSIKVNYEDGSIKFKDGKDLSIIENPLKKILVVGKTVYLISLKHAEMPNYKKKGPKELKNNDLIPMEDTVLLECEVTDGWSGTGSDLIDLKFINSYAWDASKKTYISTTGDEPGGSTGLVE